MSYVRFPTRKLQTLHLRSHGVPYLSTEWVSHSPALHSANTNTQFPTVAPVTVVPSSSVNFFALLKPEVFLNDGVELVDEGCSFVLDTHLIMENTDLCLFFAGSIIFLTADNN